jgi:hypothetical protein
MDTEIDQFKPSSSWDPKTSQKPRHWRSFGQTWSTGGSPVNAEAFVEPLLNGGDVTSQDGIETAYCLELQRMLGKDSGLLESKVKCGQVDKAEAIRTPNRVK